MLLATITIDVSVNINKKYIHNIGYQHVGHNVKIVEYLNCGYYIRHSESKIIIHIITSPSRGLFIIGTIFSDFICRN